MRILVLLLEAFGGKGGTALYNRDLLTALCNHAACQEVVAIPRLMSNPSEPLPKKITYITEGVDNKRRYILTVLKAVQRHKPFDLIICGHINLLPIVYFIRPWIKSPLLLETYGVDVWQPRKKRLINWFTREGDAAISISEITRQRFLDWVSLTRERVFLLPNALHQELYGTGPRSPALTSRYNLENKVVLMTLGRMSASEQYKGFDEILEVLPELAKKIPNIVYLAVGDGDDRRRLAAKAEALGVDDRFILTGYIKEEEKADHYRLADVYVMPSSGEGFGYVILEAMACGVPVVASECDGTREAVRNGMLGQTVDPRKPGQIKSAILRALEMPRVVPAGLEYFSFDRFSRRLHGIIDKLLGGQP